MAADQLQRRLVGLGARVGEEHPAVGAQQGEEAFGQGDLALVRKKVGGVGDRAHLAGDRLDDRRVGVAERADRDARDEVGVLPAVSVPDPAAVAAHQRQRGHPVGAHDRRLEPGLELLRGAHRPPPSGITIVPMPESVKISSSTECGSRPSSTCAWGTPPRTARRQASILGIMPALRLGRSRSRSAAVSTLITSPGRDAAPLPGRPASGEVEGPAGAMGEAEEPAGAAVKADGPAGAAVRLVSGPAGQSRYRPSTSVSITSLAAPSATARAAAAVSALTL